MSSYVHLHPSFCFTILGFRLDLLESVTLEYRLVFYNYNPLVTQLQWLVDLDFKH
jgi:hypothetical protein